MAHCLATGHGVAQDYVQARFWMHKAAEQNIPDAQFLLGVMWAEGLGGKIDLIRSRKWLERAASSGQQDAQSYLNSLVDRQL